MKFYRIIILSLLLQLVYKVEAQVSVIYQSGLNLSVSSVVTNDTATLVSLRCAKLPGENFSLPKKLLYLEDELQNKYHLISTNNIILGDTMVIPYSGYYDFSLAFEPLPPKVKIFDLRAANEQNSFFAFWGIHQDKNVLKKIKHVKDDAILCLTDVCTPSLTNTTVVGRILDYQHIEDIDSLSISARDFYGNLNTTNTKKRVFSAITDDGTFEFSLPLSHKCWTYIEGNNRNIPIFLVPGDTLYVTIENDQKVSCHTTYVSSKGYPVMHRLMTADPKWVDWDLAQSRYTTIRPSDLLREIENKKESSRALVDYLSWKYGLDKIESHLLSLQIYSFLYEIGISRLNKNFLDVYFRETGNHPKGYTDALISLPEIVDSYGFLKDIQTGDYSYFVLPSQYLLFHLANIRPIRFAKTLDLRYEILEQYLGQELDEEWRKRIDF